MPIVTGYEDTPGGHDALVLGAQLTRLTGLGAIVATVYPSDGRGLAGVRPRRPLAAPGAPDRARPVRARPRVHRHGLGPRGAGVHRARAGPGGGRAHGLRRRGRRRGARGRLDGPRPAGSHRPGANRAAAPAHEPVPRGDRSARVPAHRGRGHPLRRGRLRRLARRRPRRGDGRAPRQPHGGGAAVRHGGADHGRGARRPGARAQGRGLGPAGDRRARPTWWSGRWAACWPTCRSAPTCW